MADAGAITAEDRAHLERARALGRLGWGHVHPNPLVGCVIVRDGDVIAEGHHASYGGPHAEIVALEVAKSAAEGATVYVSLEPCDHHGQTPPCTQALIGAGVARVVFGAIDPHPEAGGGAETLRAAGVRADGPVWAPREGRAENPAFFQASLTQTPYVALKLAMSLDARIASAAGVRTRLTGPEADQEVHRLRTGFDAILVGAGTVLTDDPRLTTRLAMPGRVAPRRVLLLGSEPTLAPDAALLEDAASAPVHAFVPDDASEAAIEEIEQLGVHVHAVPGADDGVDLSAVLGVAWELGMRSILCEGGARVAASLLRASLVQRLYLFVAPRTLGAAGVPAFPEDAAEISWEDFQPVFEPAYHGRDTLLVLDRDTA